MNLKKNISEVYCNAAVVCRNGDIRVIGGTTALEGRVEVCDSQAWGTVCDDFWSSVDAGVACVQLGYQRSGNVYVKMQFQQAGCLQIAHTGCLL